MPYDKETLDAMWEAHQEAERQLRAATVDCADCAHEGRPGVLMRYKRTEHHKVTVLKERYDENAPGGVDFYDEVISAPYDVFECEYGHRWTDGY